MLTYTADILLWMSRYLVVLALVGHTPRSNIQIFPSKYRYHCRIQRTKYFLLELLPLDPSARKCSAMMSLIQKTPLMVSAQVDGYLAVMDGPAISV